MSKKKLVMLAIMDGYGINENSVGNAIYYAKKPNLDYLFSKYPTVQIGASRRKRDLSRMIKFIKACMEQYKF